MSDNLGFVAKSVATAVLATLAASWVAHHVMPLWSTSVETVSGDGARVAHALARLGRSANDFNEYERALLADVIFPEEVQVTFADVGGLEEVKRALHEAILEPMRHPERYQSRLLQSPKGLLLYGPPGNGKTLLARAVAGEFQGCFINVAPSSLFFKYVGDSQRLAKATFTLARKLAPSVLFFDELDCLFSAGGRGDHPADTQVRSVLLQGWDGLTSDPTARVVVVAATNNPALLDGAIHRRLPRQFEVPLPDVAQRRAVLIKCLEGEHYDAALVAEVAARTERYCASDLLELCKGAPPFFFPPLSAHNSLLTSSRGHHSPARQLAATICFGRL